VIVIFFILFIAESYVYKDVTSEKHIY